MEEVRQRKQSIGSYHIELQGGSFSQEEDDGPAENGETSDLESKDRVEGKLKKRGVP